MNIHDNTPKGIAKLASKDYESDPISVDEDMFEESSELATELRKMNDSLNSMSELIENLEYRLNRYYLALISLQKQKTSLLNKARL